MKKFSRTNERGGARLNFLMVVAIIAAIAYVGYQFIPVFYQSFLFKDLMQHDADVCAAQGYPASWAKDQLTKSAPEYGIPPEAVVSATLQDSRVEVRVQFVRPIPLPGYIYQYEFDHTVRSTAFLTTK